MKSLKLISSAIAMLICFVTMAQKRTITGTVSDITGPLPGVNVKIQKTKKSVFTDFEGRYSIKTKKKDILIFSYEGLKTRVTILQEKDTINIMMLDSLETINVIKNRHPKGILSH